MSEPAFAPMDIGHSAGFRPDPRFCEADLPAGEDDDPIAQARAEAYAQGYADAQQAACEQADAHDAARGALTLSFARIDREMEDDLRARLRDTVMALCEATLAPVAIDADALAGRVARAAAMIARADDDRVIRLNPADIALVAPRCAADWQIVADPSLERGAVRVEAATGGVEDGPAQWRRALAEAIGQC